MPASREMPASPETASLNGKIVLVTGASSGIGEATARLLARRGARVVMGARRTDRLETVASDLAAEGFTARAVRLDVTNRASVAAFVESAKAEFGRIDVLVNNAGVMPLSNFGALKVEEWERTIDTNVKGVLNGIAAALPVFEAQGAGHFINLSSIGGHVAYAGAGVYCASKFAVWAISDSLRQEYRNLRVTTISPGVTTSELAESISDPEARAWMKDFRSVAIPAEAIARAIAFAIEQPDDVDVNEMIVRPTASLV
jgi:NADP-dependent 3-hydroxy acid dehydrogenase YdfG